MDDFDGPWKEALEHFFQQVFSEIAEYERSKKLTYIPYYERLAMEQGEKLGLEQGLQQGIRKTLLEVIASGLETRFGQDGIQLMDKISPIMDPERLR